MFFNGGEGWNFLPKEGCDQNLAFRAIRETLGSFDPKHEHKEESTGYMFSLWFEDAIVAGDTHFRISKKPIHEVIESWPEGVAWNAETLQKLQEEEPNEG